MKRRVQSVVMGLDRRLGTDFWRGLATGVRLAQGLGRGWGRVTFLAAGLRLSVGRPRKPLRVSVSFGGGRAPMLLPDLAALLVLGEVFLQDQYERAAGPEPETILDLGANIGASALCFRAQYPTARIVCVEPDPELVDVLRRNTAQLGVEVIQAAVAAQAGQVDFYVAEESWAGSITNTSGRRVSVAAVTLDDLVAEYRPDLLKIDVEGAEYEVIAATKQLDAPRVITGEIHSPLADPRTERLLARLSRFDIKVDPQEAITLFHAVRQQA